MEKDVIALNSSGDVLFLLLGAMMVFAMHGGFACGIFGQKDLGCLGGVSFAAQVIGSATAIIIAMVSGYVVYKALDQAFGIRLSHEEEMRGSDLTVHKLESTPEQAASRF